MDVVTKSDPKNDAHGTALPDTIYEKLAVYVAALMPHAGCYVVYYMQGEVRNVTNAIKLINIS